MAHAQTDKASGMTHNDHHPGPTLIGIGAQKCASSWVHAVLGAHPQIGVSDPKELDFFSYYFDRGYHWYEAFFQAMTHCRARVEVSPSYFYDPRSPERLWAYNPDMRILVMLRDPIKRIWSNHLHEVIKGHIGAHDLVYGLENNPTYIDQSDYLRHLSAWMDVFPRAQIKVILAEDIAQHRSELVRDIYQFAGVDPSFHSDITRERRNVSDIPRFGWLRRGLRSCGDMMRRMGLEAELARIKQFGPARHVLRFNSQDPSQNIPPMDPATYDRLVARFAPDLRPLATLLGRDALPWPIWEQVH